MELPLEYVHKTTGQTLISPDVSDQESDRNIFVDDMIYLAKKKILPYYKTPIAIKQIFLSTGEMSFKADISQNMNNFDFSETNPFGDP